MLSFLKVDFNINRTGLSFSVQLLHIFLLLSIFIPSFVSIYEENNLTKCPDTISINDFLYFGPNENLCFIGKNINTWRKWGLYMCLFAVTQGCSSASAEISNAWFSNQLAIPEVKLNSLLAHLNVQLYYINWALDYVLTIFTALTQIDFLLASMLGSSIVTFITTNYYFKLKKKHVDFLDMEENMLLSV